MKQNEGGKCIYCGGETSLKFDDDFYGGQYITTFCNKCGFEFTLYRSYDEESGKPLYLFVG
jgi:hypothetical protein